MAAPTARSPLVSSSADTLSATVTSGTDSAGLGPLFGVSGSAPPGYNDKATATNLQMADMLAQPNGMGLSLTVDANGLNNEATSPGMGVDIVAANANAAMDAVTFNLAGNPLAGPSVLGISVSATFVHANANVSHIFGGTRSFVSQNASFGSLTIGGALIGKTLTFSGDAAPNTVLYDSPTVAVTLDRQVVSDFQPPDGTGSSSGSRVTTDAIDIHLKNAPLSGGSVSGRIDIAETSATLWPPLHA